MFFISGGGGPVVVMGSSMVIGFAPEVVYGEGKEVGGTAAAPAAPAPAPPPVPPGRELEYSEL